MLAIDAVTAKGITLAGIVFRGDSLTDELERPLLL
jgi:hypothetical protein